MAQNLAESTVSRAQVFPPKIDDWSETVSLYITEEIDGMQYDAAGVKSQAKVKVISFFIKDVLQAMANGDEDVAAYLAAKSHEKKLAILPILLSNATVSHNYEYMADEQKYIRELITIKLTDNMINRIKTSLDSAFAL